MTQAIDTSKTYTTRSGKRVILHGLTPRNSAGALVTFPVKGSVITSEKPRRTKYQIWTGEGRACVLSQNHPDDLIDFPAIAAETISEEV